MDRQQTTFGRALVMDSPSIILTFVVITPIIFGPGFLRSLATSALRAVVIVQAALVVVVGLGVALITTLAKLRRFYRSWCRRGKRVCYRIRSSLVSLMFARSIQASPPAMAFLHFCAFAFGYSSAESWDPELCVGSTTVGSTSEGTPFTLLGRPGSSVRTIRVYRNLRGVGYLRGIVILFSDGTEMQAGVRKHQYSEYTLSHDERITYMALRAYYPRRRTLFTFWRRPDNVRTPRVGRIDIVTNQGSWGFGIDNAAELSSKTVDVGSGLLVGFQGRAGEDMDQLAPIFLKKLSQSVVKDVVFERAPSPTGLRLMTLGEGSALWNGTDYTWSFSGSDTRDTSTSFSSGTSSASSLSSTFNAALPNVLGSGIGATWGKGTTQNHDQHSGRSTQLTWSATVPMTAENPAISCLAMVWEGRVNLRWSGIQTIMADGVTASFPTEGFLTHITYGKVETVCFDLPVPPAPVPPPEPAWLRLT